MKMTRTTKVTPKKNYVIDSTKIVQCLNERKMIYTIKSPYRLKKHLSTLVSKGRRDRAYEKISKVLSTFKTHVPNDGDVTS